MVLPVDSTECQRALVDAYRDARRKDGLIDFTEQIRADKYSLKQIQLTHLFSSKVWSDLSKKGGHRKLVNIVTGVVVEYADHKKDIDPGAAEGVMQAVQKHLNLLCNEIFKYEGYNWKQEPDYEASLKRWYRWRSEN